jgi:arsenate reductase (glutaredoxin)
MPTTVYTYSGCSTCRDATKWLRQRGVPFTEKPIRETPPTVPELRAMLRFQNGELKRLFNSSGQDYRAMNLKEKLPALTEPQALELLSRHGNLVKRPFLLSGTTGLTGFSEERWAEVFPAR